MSYSPGNALVLLSTPFCLPHILHQDHSASLGTASYTLRAFQPGKCGPLRMLLEGVILQGRARTDMEARQCLEGPKNVLPCGQQQARSQEPGARKEQGQAMVHAVGGGTGQCCPSRAHHRVCWLQSPIGIPHCRQILYQLSHREAQEFWRG